MAEAPGGRVLITGANGFLGQALVKDFATRGFPVRVAVRTSETWAGGGEAVAIGDLSGAVDWSPALAGVDCVIHAAGRAHQRKTADASELQILQRINVNATLDLARQAARADVRRLIFISSAHVNGVETHGKGFRADAPPQPAGPYAQSKLDAETGLAQVAAETGLEVVVIRPPLIIGAGVKGNLASLYGAIRRGLPLPFGSITQNRRDLVSRETLSDLAATCISHPAAPGEIFMVSDRAPLSTRALVERLAAETGRRPRLIPVPPTLLSGLLSLMGRRRMARQLTGDLEIDIEPTCERLGWRPPTLSHGAVR